MGISNFFYLVSVVCLTARANYVDFDFYDAAWTASGKNDDKKVQKSKELLDFEKNAEKAFLSHSSAKIAISLSKSESGFPQFTFSAQERISAGGTLFEISKDYIIGEANLLYLWDQQHRENLQKRLNIPEEQCNAAAAHGCDALLRERSHEGEKVSHHNIVSPMHRAVDALRRLIRQRNYRLLRHDSQESKAMKPGGGDKQSTHPRNEVIMSRLSTDTAVLALLLVKLRWGADSSNEDNVVYADYQHTFKRDAVVEKFKPYIRAFPRDLSRVLPFAFSDADIGDLKGATGVTQRVKDFRQKVRELVTATMEILNGTMVSTADPANGNDVSDTQSSVTEQMRGNRTKGIGHPCAPLTEALFSSGSSDDVVFPSGKSNGWPTIRHEDRLWWAAGIIASRSTVLPFPKPHRETETCAAPPTGDNVTYTHDDEDVCGNDGNTFHSPPVILPGLDLIPRSNVSTVPISFAVDVKKMGKDEEDVLEATKHRAAHVDTALFADSSVSDGAFPHHIQTVTKDSAASAKSSFLPNYAVVIDRVRVMLPYEVQKGSPITVPIAPLCNVHTFPLTGVFVPGTHKDCTEFSIDYRKFSQHHLTIMQQHNLLNSPNDLDESYDESSWGVTTLCGSLARTHSFLPHARVLALVEDDAAAVVLLRAETSSSSSQNETHNQKLFSPWRRYTALTEQRMYKLLQVRLQKQLDAFPSRPYEQLPLYKKDEARDELSKMLRSGRGHQGYAFRSWVRELKTRSSTAVVPPHRREAIHLREYLRILLEELHEVATEARDVYQYERSRAEVHEEMNQKRIQNRKQKQQEMAEP